MPRPTVLIATTDPCMAYALRKRLDEPCRKLGLRLDICPSGEAADPNSTDEVSRTPAYRSAEALFDYLESRKPMELADTLVVLDVGADLTNAFACKASNVGGWHQTENRAGVAVELILRFPQIFPVILSPAVPVSDEEAKEDKKDEVINPTWRESKEGEEWGGFYRLCNELCTKHKPGKPEESCKLLHALRVPLHFVSPLDRGNGLSSTLARFARGMRCWFDPTGLRTLVKNRFLDSVFGSKNDVKDNPEREKLQKLREVLLSRLGYVAIAIDEEREFAMLSAYTAYKYGRRAWVVTTFAEFDESPLWVAANEKEDTTDVVVLRDIDLRFPDIPDGDKSLARKVATPKLKEEECAPRAQLQSIISPIWSECFDGENRVGTKWLARAISSHPNTIEKFGSQWREQQPRLGESGRNESDRKYYGFVKPIASLYQLGVVLEKQDVLGQQGDKQGTVLSRLKGVGDESKGGHGAPYLNLAMAESLLQQTRRCNDGPTENLVGALLAGEAYELLLGMSKTTALEALLLLHKKEVATEVEFPGVSHDIRIDKRRDDIERTLRSLYASDQPKEMKTDVKNMFLSQFWAELRLAYKQGEQFNAAEAANVESLIRGRLMPRFSSPFIKAATSFSGWSGAAIFLILTSTVAYAWCLGGLRFLDANGDVWNIMEEVVLSSLGLQLSDCLGNIVRNKGHPGFTVAFYHIGASYVLFGLLVSMLYRKVTRS